MKTKYIITKFIYGHLIEITINEVRPQIKKEIIDSIFESIPDIFLEMILSDIESDDRGYGNFTHRDTKDNLFNALGEEIDCTISGSWRIISLRHDILYRLLKWIYSQSKEFFISIDFFKEVFGSNLGSHYFDKWEHTYKRDIKSMIWYFGTDSENGQKFLSMLQTEMEKYEDSKRKTLETCPSHRDKMIELKSKGFLQ